MAFVTASMQSIRDFLAQPRIAVAGVSRNPKDFSRTLLREFRGRGYDAVALNPEATEIDGAPCYAHLRDVQPPVDSVLVMTSPAVTGAVVDECLETGVKRVWMYRAAGTGAVNAQAVAKCDAAGVDVIPGECPMMFLRDASWFHRLHGVVKKIAGSYPK